ncbi:MAG TPA: pyridoxamine 5'-phosphate oxidase family protein [Nitrososphaera sp.]|nr:pyridoxamine 5'-phosphate oxidase family protein [Nitrososphaera sp.]
MVKIDEDILRMIIKSKDIVLVASVSPKGIPNISPRYVLGILDNEKLLFADAFENKTFHNIGAWPKVSVAVFDKDAESGGYQLKGEVVDVTDPSLMSRAETKLKEYGINLKPKKVWTLDVKEVFSLEPSEKSRYAISSYYS